MAKNRRGHLRIASGRATASCDCELETTGGSRDASAEAEAKLAALRERLDTLYGDAARLLIGSRTDSNVVTLEIPYERARPPEARAPKRDSAEDLH
jgi:hypothetical protein